MQEGTVMEEEPLEDGVQLAQSRETRGRENGWDKLEDFPFLPGLQLSVPPLLTEFLTT